MNCLFVPPNLRVSGEFLVAKFFQVSYNFSMIFNKFHSMICPGFPGVLSIFQVFQVEWQPCNAHGEWNLEWNESIPSGYIAFVIIF